MIYATKEQIIGLYGEDFLRDLLPEDITEEAEADEAINSALIDASAEIDGHLSTRYALPLAQQPKVLRRPAIDIAAYILANRHSSFTEIIEKRYEQAVAFLKRIADGKAGLGEAEPKIEVGETSSSSGSYFNANGRLFGRKRS